MYSGTVTKVFAIS